LLECVALWVIFYGPKDTWMLTAAFAVYGFTLSGILAVLGGLFAVDLSSKKAAGMAMGLVGFVSYGGAVIQELLSGTLIHDATTTLADGTKHIDFTVPVQIWFASSVASLVLASTLWKVRPRE
jgi:OPA family sugar phosphate sensor protein UhpC-like MFS transporter